MGLLGSEDCLGAVTLSVARGARGESDSCFGNRDQEPRRATACLCMPFRLVMASHGEGAFRAVTGVLAQTAAGTTRIGASPCVLPSSGPHRPSREVLGWTSRGTRTDRHSLRTNPLGTCALAAIGRAGRDPSSAATRRLRRGVALHHPTHPAGQRGPWSGKGASRPRASAPWRARTPPRRSHPRVGADAGPRG